MTAWSLDRARHTYSIPYWSEGYFDVDAAGRMLVLPRGPGGPALALPEVVNQATAAGLKLPLLLRFSDVLGDRLGKLQAAFGRAIAELDYTGGYTAVASLDDLSVLDVVEAVEGPTDVTRCVLEDRPCAGGQRCALHDAWAQARSHLLRDLAATPLSAVAHTAP